MTNKALYDKFQQMMADQVQDFVTNFGEAMEKLDGLEKTFDTKMDAKFNEVLARLPPPAAVPIPFERRARRVPLGHAQHPGTVDTAATSVARAATVSFKQEDSTFYFVRNHFESIGKPILLKGGVR